MLTRAHVRAGRKRYTHSRRLRPPSFLYTAAVESYASALVSWRRGTAFFRFFIIQPTPAEIAGIVVYLASDAASYHNGDTITIDGGWSVDVG